MNDIPNDNTGNAIQEIISNGVDLKRKMDIDFFITVTDEGSGNKIIGEVKNYDFKTSLEYDTEYSEWTCYCTKNMFLDYILVVEVENFLEKIANKYNANIDGFGSYGNV